MRIPASVMASAGLSLNQAVEVREGNGQVVIERSVARSLQPHRSDAVLSADNETQGLSVQGSDQRCAWQRRLG